MIYFTKPSGRVKQANPVFAPPRASNWLASLAVIGLFASPAYGQVTDPAACNPAADSSNDGTDGSTAVGCGATTAADNEQIAGEVEGTTTIDAVPRTYIIRTVEHGRRTFANIEGTLGRNDDGQQVITLTKDYRSVGLGNVGAEIVIREEEVTDERTYLGLSIDEPGRAEQRGTSSEDAVMASVDQRQTAVGSSAFTQGSLNTAIGANSRAAGFDPGVTQEDAILDSYTIRTPETGRQTFSGVQGTLSERTNADGVTEQIITLTQGHPALHAALAADGISADAPGDIIVIRADEGTGDEAFLGQSFVLGKDEVVGRSARTSGITRATAVGADTSVQSNRGTALGAGASVAGTGSIAIGNNARVGTVGVYGSAVAGEYHVTRSAATRHGTGSSTGVNGIRLGTGTGSSILLTEDTVVVGPMGGEQRVTLRAGTSITLSAAPTPTAGTTEPTTAGVAGTYDITYAASVNTRLDNVEGTLDADGVLTVTVASNGLNIGDKIRLSATGTVVIRSTSSVTESNTFNEAHNAVAIGNNAAVTGDNGIAIGAGATAGANQIRIGNTQTDVQIGAYNLAEIRTNTADIQTNRAGIASAVAIANLPSVQGPKGGWSLALGSFDGETAIAGGINFDVLSSSIVKISVASSDGETSAGIGFGMGF